MLMKINDIIGQKFVLKLFYLKKLNMFIKIIFNVLCVFCLFWIIHSVFIQSNNHYLNQINIGDENTDEYIIYPKNFCKSNTLQHTILIAYVISAPINFQKRMKIRNTWSNDKANNLKVLFLIGKSLNENLNNQIKWEHIKFNDILQANFLDSYRNLTLKTIIGMKYLADNCLNSSYFLAKIDDDVMVNTKQLMRYLNNTINQKINITNRFFCNEWINATVRRSKSNKFYVSFEELSVNTYPTYCDGPAYIYSNDLLLNIKNAINSTKIFRFEDVYSGLLASKLNSKFISIKEKYSDENSIDDLIEKNETDSKFFFYPIKEENFDCIWKKMNKSQ